MNAHQELKVISIPEEEQRYDRRCQRPDIRCGRRATRYISCDGKTIEICEMEDCEKCTRTKMIWQQKVEQELN